VNQHTPDTETARLLLVADDLIFPSRVREGVRPQGFVVQVAATGERALDAARTTPYPVAILVNLTSRRYDALDVISRLKADSQTRTIPLLAFAGHTEIERHQAARRAGADRTAANSSVALHLPQLLQRLLHPDGKDSSDDVIETEE
jgi:CheY-like chemotaxis protein